MDNSLLVVRDINHKYIVVEKERYLIMITGDAIYITYWSVDKQKAYTAALANSSELPMNFNKVFSKGPFFSNLDAAKNWANHLKNKYYFQSPSK